jgi:hypothetical protein
MSDTTFDARVVRLETLAENTHEALQRIERRIEDVHSTLDARVGQLDAKLEAYRSEVHDDLQGMDARLRTVEQGQAAMSAQLNLLASSIIAKLPSWWQMPIVIGATVTLLAALYAGAQFLRLHGW